MTALKETLSALPSEELLLDLFSEKDECTLDEAVISEFLDSSTNPDVLRDLTPQRHLLLNWFPFKSGSSLLELGARNGALTGLFLRSCAKVTAVEPNTRRAEVLKHRYKNFKHLELVNQPIASYSTTKMYDYVVLAEAFVHSDIDYDSNSEAMTTETFIKLLRQSRTYLKDSGSLILSMSNQLALKYFAGNFDEYTGKLFESVTNYPHHNGPRSFGKTQIQNFLQEAGYSSKQSWYYPFPNSIFPHQIFAEELLGKKNTILSSLYPSPAGQHGRYHLFNETLSAEVLRENKLLTDFANSFLVIVPHS